MYDGEILGRNSEGGLITMRTLHLIYILIYIKNFIGVWETKLLK